MCVRLAVRVGLVVKVKLGVNVSVGEGVAEGIGVFVVVHSGGRLMAVAGACGRGCVVGPVTATEAQPTRRHARAAQAMAWQESLFSARERLRGGTHPVMVAGHDGAARDERRSAAQRRRDEPPGQPKAIIARKPRYWAGQVGSSELLGGAEQIPCSLEEGSDVLVSSLGSARDLAHNDENLCVEYCVNDSVVAATNAIQALDQVGDTRLLWVDREGAHGLDKTLSIRGGNPTKLLLDSGEKL